MKFAVFILLGASMACAKKVQPQLPDLEIPPSCTQKILGKHCDTSFNPPKCKTIVVDYSPASCAIIHVP
jgi:hypothetical protein